MKERRDIHTLKKASLLLKINSHCWLEPHCSDYSVFLSPYENKRRTGTVALIRVNTVIANIAPEGRFYSDIYISYNCSKSRTIDEPFVRRTVGKG